MNGLIIWSQSNCRSTMALYRELIRLLGVPSLITLWHYSERKDEPDLREKVGFCHSEFADLPMLPVGENYETGLRVVREHHDWHHLFCVYQPSSVYRRLIGEIKRSGGNVGVMCESPCNMASGWHRILKYAYIRFCLPWVVRDVTHAAAFFVNYSGNDWRAARRIGWDRDKILPFGYFPPPIVGSKLRLRHRDGSRPLFILATGILSKYRGADVLVDALKILKARGVAYRAVITQEGELFEELRRKSEKMELGIEFLGFVELPRLIELYETCDVYVGTGRYEPWGMRLNDALQCGAPLVVSRGMGGVQMVDDYGCGVSFQRGNATDLAAKLEKLSWDVDYYNSIAQKVVNAVAACSPTSKAKQLLLNIRANFGEWFA